MPGVPPPPQTMQSAPPTTPRVVEVDVAAVAVRAAVVLYVPVVSRGRRLIIIDHVVENVVGLPGRGVKRQNVGDALIVFDPDVMKNVVVK
jgi:hypothetical protein